AGEDYPIFDGINGLVVSGDQMSAEVGDFDCDGKDEIAWRHAGWPAWAITDESEPIQLIIDDLFTYDPLQSAQAVGDFDGDGCDDLAWRNKNDDAWNVNSLNLPLWKMEDGQGEGFDPSVIFHFAGDFDSNGRDDVAWRFTGAGSWYVSSTDGLYFLEDFYTNFDVDVSRAVAGDFDGDGQDDVAFRETGWTQWLFTGDGVVDYLPGSPNTFDKDLPVHVGDFNGDGKDNVAWLPNDTDTWEVDADGPFEGKNKFRWQETTENLELSYEIIYTDVNLDGNLDDLVIMVKNPDDSAYLIHKPLMQAYFAKSQGWTITDAWYEGLSPVQQQAFFDDCQTPELQSTFTNTADATEFNQTNANGNFESMTEMAGEVEYVAVEDIQDTGEVSGSVRLIDFSASGVYEENGAGGEVGFNVTTIAYNFGDVVSGEVVALEASANMYVGKGGFSIGAGATLVAADADFGNPEGSHVSLGVGVGIGAGVDGKWGENDIYGGEIDVKFFKVGVYIKGEDAEQVFNDGVDWCVGAGNSVANWGETAWGDTVGFFEDAGDGFLGFANNAFDGLTYGFDSTVDGLEFLAGNFEETFTGTAKDIENFGSDTWNDIEEGGGQVISDIEDGWNDATGEAGNFITTTWNSIF
ncbi:MAG: hypothetical protein AAF682_32265, partial [Planctomycetota bacterium]